MLTSCFARQTLGIVGPSRSVAWNVRSSPFSSPVSKVWFKESLGRNCLHSRGAASVAKIAATLGRRTPQIGRVLGVRGLFAGGAGVGAFVLQRLGAPSSCDSVKCDAVAAQIPSACPLGHGIKQESQSQKQCWFRRVSSFLWSFTCWSLFLGIWSSAFIFPLVFVGAICTAQWGLAGILWTLFCIPHVLPMPRFKSVSPFLVNGIAGWQKQNPRYIDLSKAPVNSEPEPEPAPGVASPTRKKPKLYCAHPHGILSLGVVNAVNHMQETRLCGSAFLYNFAPTFRIGLSLLGCKMGSVSPRDLNRYMENQEPELMIVPGGFHEATIACKGHERVYLKNRKGFVKYALRHGYDLVPVYTFGEGDLYSNPQGGWCWRFALNNICLPTVLPWGFTWMPLFPNREAEVTTVVGPPVPMPHIKKPTTEDVRVHHDRYVKALEEIYRKTAPVTASKNRKLEIW